MKIMFKDEQDVEEWWAGKYLQKETRCYLKKTWDSKKVHTHSHTDTTKYFNDFPFLWSTLEFTHKPFAFVVIQILFLFLLPPTVYSWFPEFGLNKGEEVKFKSLYFIHWPFS